jgi:hypothetical protein
MKGKERDQFQERLDKKLLLVLNRGKTTLSHTITH